MHGDLPPLPQYVFMEWCLVKHGDNITVYCLQLTNSYGVDYEEV